MPSPNQTEIELFIQALEETPDVTTSKFFKANKEMVLSLFLKGFKSYMERIAHDMPFLGSKYILENSFTAYVKCIFSKSYNKELQEKFLAITPKLEIFLKSNKSLLSKMKETVSKTESLFGRVQDSFLSVYWPYLLEHYLALAPNDWTAKNTKEILPIYEEHLKKTLHGVAHSDVLPWEEIQEALLNYVNAGAKKLNNKKQSLEKYLELYIDPNSNTIPDNVLKYSEQQWTQFLGSLNFKTKPKDSNAFIHSLKDGVLHKKATGLALRHIETIDRFYTKSEKGIIDFILSSKQKDPKGLNKNENISELLNLLAKSLYQQWPYAEKIGLTKLTQHLEKHFLKSIQDLFQLSDDKLKAKINSIREKNKKIQLAKQLLKDHLNPQESEVEVDATFSAEHYSQTIEDFFIDAVDSLSDPDSAKQTLNTQENINYILSQAILLIMEDMKNKKSPNYKTFYDLMHHSENPNEMHSNIQAYLYDEYEPLIKNLLEDKARSLKAGELFIQPPSETVSVEDIESSNETKANYPKDTDEQVDAFKIRLDTDPDTAIAQLEQQYIEKIKELVENKIPDTLYKDYKKNNVDESQIWHRKILNPLATKYRNEIMARVTKNELISADKIEKTVEKRIHEIFRATIDIHDKRIRDARLSSQASQAPKIRRP